MSDIEVSVVMSVYNGQEYLREAIESILNQTFKNFEFIIVNDGSYDDSLNIIKSYNDPRIVLINQQNTGLAVALNNGIRLANSKYIARMDADDIAMIDRLEKQKEFLDQNLDYVLVGSNAIVTDKDGNAIYTSKLPLDWELIKTKFPDSSFYHSSVMYRKDTFIKCSGYLEEVSKLNCFEDSILWNKMKNYGKMANIFDTLIKYRLVPNASTSKSGTENVEIRGVFLDILEKNKLSDENRERILAIKRNLSKNEKERVYYIHIAKKYLFNNYKPANSRENIIKSIKLNIFTPYPYILLILTYIPYSFITLIYKQIKN